MVIRRNFVTHIWASALFATALSLVACADPWVPTGGAQRADDNRCDPRRIEAALLALPNLPRERRDFVDSYLKECDSVLTQDAPEFFDTVSLGSKMQYDYWNNPDFRSLKLVGTDGSQLEAHLLIREGNIPRPLVIIKCGLQCDLGDSSLKYLVAHLRDTAPVHMLLLGSNTSPNYLKSTGRITVGGFDEGRNIVKAARYLQSDGFRDHDKISRVIVVGMSLGGHAALYSALYNSFLKNTDGRPYISSVIAACPVVDLEVSVKRLFSEGVLGQVMQERFLTTLTNVAKFIPFLRLLIKDRNEGEVINEMGGIPALIARGGLDYYKDATRNPSWGMAPLAGHVVTDETSFWAINRFQNFAALNTTPTLLWASADDPVVHPENNLDVLEQKFANVEDSNYIFLRSRRGFHCNFTEGYGWRAASSILRNLVLADSPELVSLREVHRGALTGVRDIGRSGWFPSSAHRVKLQWQAIAGTRDVRIAEEMKFFCAGQGSSRGGTSQCKETRYSEVDSSVFGFTDGPKNELEAQTRTRWLNSNVWAWSKPNGQLDGFAPLSQVEWHTWNIDGDIAR